MKECNAIEVKNVYKSFKVYPDRSNNIKDFMIHGNRRRYENREVLKGICFEVKKGEAIGLIGHNGCGKSTTLKLLTKIMYPDKGSIEMRGRVSSLIELGAGFHPDMSGRENIYINASIFGLKKKEIDARIADIIAFSELEEFIDNPVRTYSSGMYMRLAFAVAINVDADILLVDEILAVGDIAFQAKCFKKLKEIKKQGTTIVIVSHALGQIEEICENSYWIHEGKVKMSGHPVDVHAHYLEYMGVTEDETEEEEEKENFATERMQCDMEKIKKELGAVSRQLAELRWKEVDRGLSTSEKKADEISCSICGYTAIRGSYETRESDCVFGGGHLVRYVCPTCGAIFGPTKFTDLGIDGIEDEYRIHYMGYREGESIDKEIRAFKMLNPDKKKIYLHYGYGKSMESVNMLREEGYQVYGYEPYINEGNNPYVFKDKGQLIGMKFDGIFSDDLLEHLLNPIEELRFMKSLLLDKDSLMAHSTGCYEYVHEVTRFHIHFFTGDATKFLAEKAGLELIEKCDDLKDNDFICCVFRDVERTESGLDCMPFMCASNAENVLPEMIKIPADEIAFGPYLTLRSGIYTLQYELDAATDDISDVLLRVTTECGNITLLEFRLEETCGEKRIHLDKLSEKIEFVFENKSTADIHLKKLCLCPEKW